MKEFWNERYSKKEFAYGATPNVFVKDKLKEFNPSKILFPAEGEGRNAVYAAELGWTVSAFDFSELGKQKADALAMSKGVSIDYQISSFLDVAYEKESFDVVCNVFVHFEPSIKLKMHKKLDGYLKKGGIFIIEAFSKDHRELNKKDPNVGGPQDVNMMYSLEEIKADFSTYEILELSKTQVKMEEGYGHVGLSSVIRFVGRKK